MREALDVLESADVTTQRYLELVLPSGCCCGVVRTNVKWAPATGPSWLRMRHWIAREIVDVLRFLHVS